MKLDEKKCKFCYEKRFYTVIWVKSGAEDFGGQVACTKCNRNNRRKIKGVYGAWWNV
jgi:hypothetical protein